MVRKSLLLVLTTLNNDYMLMIECLYGLRVPQGKSLKAGGALLARSFDSHLCPRQNVLAQPALGFPLQWCPGGCNGQCGAPDHQRRLPHRATR